MLLFLGEMLTATAMGWFEEQLAAAIVLALPNNAKLIRWVSAVATVPPLLMAIINGHFDLVAVWVLPVFALANAGVHLGGNLGEIAFTAAYCEIEATYLRPEGAPIVTRHTVAGNSRFNTGSSGTSGSSISTAVTAAPTLGCPANGSSSWVVKIRTR